MRLTLRTLLAWLDDTLPPAEVRQIGQQVAETPLAQELVDRIHRVTRQRRLTVPSDSGHEGVDPNVVASYIGDTLTAEQVAEYEKRCLTSDVYLAEIASVHQILSLLAQRAKVPPEARQRMYHLIKGRESVGPAVPRTFSPPKEAVAPVSVAAWAPPPVPSRSLVERYGPVAAALAFIAILCWSAWLSIGTNPKPGGEDLALTKKAPLANDPGKAVVPAVGAAKDANAAKAVATEKDAIVPVPDPAATKPADPMPEPDAKAKLDEVKPIETKAALPAGAVGVVGKADEGILLRHNPDANSWDRLVAGASLREGDRLVNLPPFQTPLQIGTSNLTMIGGGEIKVLAPGVGTSARFELVRGRVRITGSLAKDPIAVPFDSGLLKLTVPPATVAGLERVSYRAPGDKLPSAPGLRITSAEGTITAESGAASETLAAGTSILFHAPNVFTAKTADPVPSWISDTGPSAADQERGKRMVRYIKPNLSPIVWLVEALDDENAEVRHDAISALGAVGSLDLIVTSLTKKGDPASRKAAIAVLRDVARRDAASADALRTELLRFGGSPEWAETAEKLLVGYSAREAADETNQVKLVNLLKHEDVGIRELALEALQAISRRGDSLGYDPDKPQDADGLKAWQDLVQRHELRIPAAPKPK
ncbi:MAG: hypothetical protein JWN86_4658 [Planctomycetota bacterium]|nr:hypothetical protein [Planctomycetota bacterium]